jgi:hypothetical protein
LNALVLSTLVIGLFILMGREVYGQEEVLFLELPKEEVPDEPVSLPSFLSNETQDNRPDNFLSYSNNQMKFNIQYPSNWKVNDFDVFIGQVNFRPDREDIEYRDDISRFEIGFEISTVKIDTYLDTDTMTLKNTSLEQHFQRELNSIQSDYEKKLIKQNKVTVGGNTGWKVEYTETYYYSFDIFTIANGNFYRLSYTDEQSKVPETLPSANKMVESFQTQS